MVDTVTYNPDGFTVVGNFIPHSISFTSTGGTVTALSAVTIEGNSVTGIQIVSSW
jgi:hypothetical protein